MPEPEPTDDLTIPSDAKLWHRVFPKQKYKDPQTGKYRPMSGAFRDHKESYPGLSVYIAGKTTPEAALKPAPEMYLVEFPLSAARDKNCKIVRDPDENPAHALIFGSGTGGRLTKTEAEHLASNSRFIIPDPSSFESE